MESLADDKGAMRMQDLPNGKFTSLKVSAAGYLGYPDSLGPKPEGFRSFAAGHRIRFEVALHRGGSVRGVARDRKGAPVPRAWVRVCTSLPDREPLDAPIIWTAEDGSYFVPMAHPGRAYIQARGPGCSNEGSTISWVDAREKG